VALYLIVAGDFVTTGGMDRANHALASYLTRRGDEVHLVAHRVAEDLLAHPNVVFHRVPKPAGSYLLAGPLLDRVGRYWAKRVSVRGGRVIVNGGNCRWGDVNWVHYVHAAYAPRVAGHALRQAKSSISHRLFKRHERRALCEARVVIANSRRTSRDLTERLGVAPAHVRVVYYGTDPEAFRPLPDGHRDAVRHGLGWDAARPKVAFVGALGDRRKGFDTLFEAWKQLCATGGDAWPVDLVVIGQGAELSTWRRRAAEVGLSGRIQFLGFRNDVPTVLAACDALVAPTRYEAYGLGVQEALCCGIPAFVSRDSGVAERFPPGLSELMLDDPSGVDGLKVRLINWRQNMPSYGRAAHVLSSTLRKYTWQCMAEEFVAAASS
jgi:glycosyltransferase involved in cell wall biosynthesis